MLACLGSDALGDVDRVARTSLVDIARTTRSSYSGLQVRCMRPFLKHDNGLDISRASYYRCPSILVPKESIKKIKTKINNIIHV